jgi:hypothetical protein
MKSLRAGHKLRAFRLASAVVAAVFLAWALVHVAFYARKIPQYKLVPLSTNPTEYSKALARFSDHPSALDNVKIPVLSNDQERLVATSDEAQIKRLVAGRFWLRPRKIERIEFSATNVIYVVVRPLFGRSESTLFVGKEKAKWFMFAGEAK